MFHFLNFFFLYSGQLNFPWTQNSEKIHLFQWTFEFFLFSKNWQVLILRFSPKISDAASQLEWIIANWRTEDADYSHH